MRKIIGIAAVAGLLVAATAFTGCANASSAVGGSCAAVEKALHSLSSDMSTALAGLSSSDLASAASSAEEVHDRLAAKSKSMEDPHVRRAYERLVGDLGALAGSIGDAAEAHGDTTALLKISDDLTAKAGDIQEDVQAVQKVCVS